jgi:phosphoserine phosphatase RsbU/P
LFCQNPRFEVCKKLKKISRHVNFMKKPTLLYLPLLALFVVAATAFALNVQRVSPLLDRFVNPPAVRSPIRMMNAIQKVEPEAAEAGLQTGDRPISINGRELGDENAVIEELRKTKPGERINYVFERKTQTGDTERREANVVAVRAEETSPFERAASFFVMTSFWILLPAVSFLLGFWVVLVRPRDPLAWLLLLLLLSIGSLGFDGSRGFLSFIQGVFIQYWGVWMLLFGIYFPERLEFDRRYPFLKYVFIVPLAFLGTVNVIRFVSNYSGFESLGRLMSSIIAPLGVVQIVLIMLCIGSFFAALGWKSGTLKNPDSRRRLRLLTIGTSVAMLPSFVIVLYSIFSGKRGPAFEIVPSWLAIISILAMLLFPLTLAYVIVVQRAMDVSVVVRQGLQYALAKGGVRVLQFLLLLGIGLGVLWTIRNYGADFSAQIAFIVGGVALVPLIDLVARRLRVWIDRRFFREAYNAEQILSDLSEEVRTMVETKPLLETVSHKISESLHVPQVVLLLKNGNGFKPAYALGYDADMPPFELSENGALIEKLRKNEPLIVYADDPDSWVNEQDLDDERQILRALNSQLLLPVGARQKLSGFISLSPKRSEAPYTPNDLRLLRSVAAQTGLALENSRLTEAVALEMAQRERLNREVEIAREVQERLFPQEQPKIEGLDYAGACRPALGVGGDYYDFLQLPDGKFGIAVGDVSGKGIAAALLMASLQASLRGAAIQGTEDLATLMSHVNKLVYDASTSNRYATFFYSQYDSKTRRLAYVNAGHNPPFLFRQNGKDYELLRLEDGGAVVGMLPPEFIFYKQGEIELQTGDLLVGFTDGISEAMNPAEEEWGEENMIAAIKTQINLKSSEMLKYLVEQADAFADGAKQHDDMTLIIVRVI